MLISPDTGAVHVAAAMGTPVVAAYEADTFEHCSVQWKPWKVRHKCLVKGDPSDTIEAILDSVKVLMKRSST